MQKNIVELHKCGSAVSAMSSSGDARPRPSSHWALSLKSHQDGMLHSQGY